MRDPALHDRVRWLLGALVEPAFLRLYLEQVQERQRPTFRAFEDAFFSLPISTERPKDHCRDAWRQLETWVEPVRMARPATWFCAVLWGLRSEYREIASDLGRFWALGELFDDGASEVNQRNESGTQYHEIHCHLRGGIPYLALWRGFIESERKRAALRTFPCEAGTWKRTWAELVADAVHDRAECLHQVPDAGHDEAAHIRALVQHVVDSRHADISDHTEHAARYLATCAGLSAFLLHQRGRTGLSPFVESYDRYSKLQKPRGSPERQQVRELVVATLQRFVLEGAVAVELRPTLDRSRSALRRKLQDIVLGYFDYLHEAPPGQTPLALGLIPSLFKQEGLFEVEPTDPAIWGEQQESWCNQVRALLAVLEDSPALRWFVVGLDAAGKERGCPPGVLRTAFDLVRGYNRGRDRARPGRRMSVGFLRELRESDESGGSDAALDKLDRSAIEPIRLGVTVHAGEDFEDPLTGLRHIWETAVDLDLREGDRIGHALAAGLDERNVRRLLERRAGAPDNEVIRLGDDCFAVRKPRGTHLLDLAWLCRIAQQSDARDAELGLGETATRAFGAPLGAARLARELGYPDTGALKRTALPGIRFGDPRYLGAHDVEIVTIDAAYRALFERLRKRVVGEMVRRRIVVESCPTSNLVVANLDEPPILTFLQNTDLRVTLATDDPGLLGVFPRAEMQRVPAHAQDRLLTATAQASFVRRAEDG